MKHIAVMLGTRPEVIKLAPVIHTLRGWPTPVRVTVCSTGQHRELLDQTLASFDLQPDCDLALMEAAQHPTDLIGRMLPRLRQLLDQYGPDTVVVQGDTSTVLAAALAAFLHQVQVAHVEAGLRSGDKQAPFPEEMNRRVTSVLTDVHFAPTAGARDRLLAEQIAADTIFVTGNTVIDALYWMRAKVANRPLPPELDPGPARLILVTAHRRESFGQPLRDLCGALRDIAERFNDVCLVYPVHLNPRVQETARNVLDGCPRVRLVDPVDYATLVALLARSYLVITDSGGIQEEAPALGKPILVTREKTERPEAVAAGVARLVGTDRTRIVQEASILLSDPAAYDRVARPVEVYGDGKAARRIAEVLTTGRMTTAPFEPRLSRAD